jgi:CheY-like chemotaxis protein
VPEAASPTILVVVRDGDVRDLIQLTLEQSGYSVHSAADEADAVKIAGSTKIDLLVTELAPSVDGRSIAERLRMGLPDLRVLFTTGWFDHPGFDELPGEMIIKQPFSRDDLMRAIDTVLGGWPG